MADYDLVIAGGTVVTPADMFRADVGVVGDRVAAIGVDLRGTRMIDAQGLLVMPGGVDSHCHIEQLQRGGGADEENFVTGSTSALAGGTTSVITFSTQFKGHGILEPLAEYRRRVPVARSSGGPTAARSSRESSRVDARARETIRCPRSCRPWR